MAEMILTLLAALAKAGVEAIANGHTKAQFTLRARSILEEWQRVEDDVDLAASGHGLPTDTKASDR